MLRPEREPRKSSIVLSNRRSAFAGGNDKTRDPGWRIQPRPDATKTCSELRERYAAFEAAALDR